MAKSSLKAKPSRRTSTTPIASKKRAYDRNVSPVGWYVGSFLLRFVEIGWGSKRNSDLQRRFLSWENTILVRAKSLDEAFDKVVKVGKSQSEPYKGGPNQVPVRWIFEGVTELLPIYEEIEDGSEIMWCQRDSSSLRSLRRLVKSRTALKQ